MNEKIRKIALIALAVVAGYAVMILGLLLTQDLSLGRVEFGITPLWKIPLVGIGALASAALGGWVAFLISKSKKLIPQIIMAGFTIFETTALLMEGALTNPLWFELLSELTLIVGILGAGYLASRGSLPSTSIA
ncbi:MAG: hypothetical protein R8P61_34115 [Bacteroidia bacterium]|nr:hypothetical protein [Bacteroidia bacterium]